jgi:hypothetical protein
MLALTENSVDDEIEFLKCVVKKVVNGYLEEM